MLVACEEKELVSKLVISCCAARPWGFCTVDHGYEGLGDGALV